jgi:hypothetical protein
MTSYTDKTFRSATQWVKVTRDNKNRTFTFARGHKDNFTAHETETLSFKWVANWTEAQERALRSMAYFA